MIGDVVNLVTIGMLGRYPIVHGMVRSMWTVVVVVVGASSSSYTNVYMVEKSMTCSGKENGNEGIVIGPMPPYSDPNVFGYVDVILETLEILH
jgi:hypothetical protein